MPTARPSITTSIRVVELMASTPVPAITMKTLMPTPLSAVAMGIIAASRPPSTITRTTMATRTPIASTALNSGRCMAKTSPPTSTVAPGSSSVSRWAAATSSARCSSVKVETVPSTRTRASAWLASSLTRPSMNSLNGDWVPFTKGRSSSSPAR